MTEATVTLDDLGRLEVPAEFRRALGLRAGVSLVLRLASDGLYIQTSGPTALEEAQSLVRAHVEAGRSLVDELIAERRRSRQGRCLGREPFGIR